MYIYFSVKVSEILHRTITFKADQYKNIILKSVFCYIDSSFIVTSKVNDNKNCTRAIYGMHSDRNRTIKAFLFNRMCVFEKCLSKAGKIGQ